MPPSFFPLHLRKPRASEADAPPGRTGPEAAAPAPEPLFPLPREYVAAAEQPAAAAAQAAPDTPAPPPAAPPTVIVRPLGGVANRMIQHMTAMKIASLVPGARISRIQLPEWGLEEADIPDIAAPTINLDRMYADVEATAAALREGRAESVEITGYVQHMNNFLGPEAYRGIFSSDMPVEAYGDDVLLINIRTAEILTAIYLEYVLIPIAFYRQIIRETGLRPVFFGQLTGCPYIDELRAAFPEAVFRNGDGVIHDWEVVRRSKNICMSVSSFSWAACWLSDADRIFMPLSGLLNPVQGALLAHGHNLVPVDDNRFLFYNFPLNVAVPQDRYREVHQAMDGQWRLVTGAWITNMLERREHLPRSLDDHLALFDEELYLLAQPEVAIAKARGWIADGRAHYVTYGFKEKRQLCRVDMDYANRYPDAAMAVSNGAYLDLLHFHAERGRHLGYQLRGF